MSLLSIIEIKYPNKVNFFQTVLQDNELIYWEQTKT